MSRPRIRTLKPELWQDEKVGGLSRDARLLFIGLVTMADDEGRLRALPALILGHVFPYDVDAYKKVAVWLLEITDAGLAQSYQVGGTPYVQLLGWKKHQVINKANDSELPPPPVPSRSGSAPVAVREADGPHAGGRAIADRIGSEGNGSPPLPPDGGRKRDHENYRVELRAWAEREFAATPTSEVLRAINRLRSANVPESEITKERILRRIPHFNEEAA